MYESNPLVDQPLEEKLSDLEVAILQGWDHAYKYIKQVRLYLILGGRACSFP